MARYRTGTKLRDGKIVVRNDLIEVINGHRQVVDRGLRIKYDNHIIDLDVLRKKYRWTDKDYEQAVAHMEDLVETRPRGRGRGFFRDELVTSAVVANAEAKTVQKCIAFWPQGDKQVTCGEVAVEGSLYCTEHNPTPEGAGAKVPAASGSKKGK